MRSGLAGKVAFITGASGGIGRALAEVFAEEDARLVLHGNRQMDELRSWVAEQPWGDDALCVQADIGDPDQVDRAMETAVEHFGRVDCCVANAGIWPVPDEPLHEMPAERFERTLRVNLFGAAWTARAFIAQLARTGPHPEGHGAALVFTGSTAGRFGERDHCDYSAAKAGLHGLMRSLKNEIARVDPYARVNVVEPGWTATHMARPALQNDDVVRKVTRTMALRQIGRARDIAHAIAFLCSPLLGRHISGEILTVAGGMEGRLLWQGEDIDVEAVRRRLEDRG